MHILEKKLFNHGVKVTQNVAQYPLHHKTYALAKFEVATTNSLGGDIHSVTLTTRNVAQYPLYHAIYASAKFEVV